MSGRRVAHQVLATLGYGDAIGHEVLAIQRVLRHAGYESEIFIETADPRLEPLTRDYHDLTAASHPDHLLVHHFSIGSPASRVAYALPDRMMLVYHNITPPEFYAGINRELVRRCFRGRRELRAYAARCELALGDSEFNRSELEAFGFPATGVLPVVADFSHLDVQPNRLMAGALDDERHNILFVGRVVPNKKIEDLIRIFHAYKTRFQAASRLLIVGSYGGYERYLASLQHLVASLSLTRDVVITGDVSNEELTAYYDVADLFLCASEHEGFCVPLIEAFYKDIPVVAFAATAVPATMDGAGVLYDRKDPVYVAGLINAVLSDAAVADRITAGQQAALARLRSRDFAGALLGFTERALAMPRRPRVEVAWDFWTQFEALDHLEDLRLDRPAIYRALPEKPHGLA